jgi:hypothetical protein
MSRRFATPFDHSKPGSSSVERIGVARSSQYLRVSRLCLKVHARRDPQMGKVVKAATIQVQ